MTLEDRAIAVVVCAKEILRDFDAVMAFLTTPNESLQNREPRQALMSSEAGAIEVMALLGKMAGDRIANG